MAGASRNQPARKVTIRPLSSGAGKERATVKHDIADRPAHGDSSLQDSTRTNGNEVDPLGAHAKEAAALISKLAQIGLDSLDIPLPKCVVLGQQSTGKSSVIEALTGIKTPRDTGTCTRCPLMIDLEPSEDPQAAWHASIYLQQRYRWDPQAENNGKFPDWVEKAAPDRIAFAQTDDPGQLERLIQCAQQATLSPTQDPQSFLDISFDGSYNSSHQCLFSPNVVGIQITKHGLPALSFYDLPGLISQAETEAEEYTVPLVRNLVSEYISSQDTLVLVTCALENDVANSTAGALARDKNATERCIGVLTKPDRLPHGTPSKMLSEILDGARFKLGHGYHVTKNLDQDQIKQGITHQEARLLEEEFFKTQDPWASDLQAYQQRFGILNLQTFLSRQHAKHALAKLPTIEAEVDERLASVDEELKRIPETPPHTAVRVVLDILVSFSDEIRHEIEEDFGYTTWKNMWQEIRTRFYDSLEGMKPWMSTRGELDQNLYSQSLPASGLSIDDSITIDSDDDASDNDDNNQSDASGTPSKKRKFGAPFKSTPTKKRSTPVQKTTAPSRDRNISPKKEAVKNENQPAVTSNVIQLDKFRLELGQSSQSKVPGLKHPKVHESLMIKPLQQWQVPLDVFFQELEERLRKHIKTLFVKHFKDRKDSELYTKAWVIVNEMIDDNLSLQKSTIAAESLKAELQGPYIFHGDAFKTEKQRVLEDFAKQRQTYRMNAFMKEAIRHGRNARTLTTERLGKEEQSMAIIRSEPYAAEIDVIADMRAYYGLAARRFHDSVCMRVESNFFKQLREELRNELDARLGISNEADGAENAQRLLAESTARFKRRRELVAKKTALLKGKSYVIEFQRKCETDDLLPGSGGSSGYSSPDHVVLTPSVDAMDLE